MASAAAKQVRCDNEHAGHSDTITIIADKDPTPGCLRVSWQMLSGIVAGSALAPSTGRPRRTALRAPAARPA